VVCGFLAGFIGRYYSVRCQDFRSGLLGLEVFTRILRVGTAISSPVLLLWLPTNGAALTTPGFAAF
jgi:hypothetical protein